MNREELISAMLPEIKKVVDNVQIPPPVDDLMIRQRVYIDFGFVDGRRVGYVKVYERSVLQDMVQLGINPVDHTLRSFISDTLDYLSVLEVSGLLG